MEIERDDATRETFELEKRSTLYHDLVHNALESQGAHTGGLYGRQARGTSYEALLPSNLEAASHEEIAEIEGVVGPLQGAWKTGLDAGAFVARLRRHAQSTGAAPPSWLTEDLVARAGERLRRLEGQWRGTRFGEAMELTFSVGT
jgi:hypothetical protein